MDTIRLGAVTIDRIVETEGLGFYPGFLFPQADLEALHDEAHWLAPQFFDPGSGRLRQSLHGFLIRTPRHTVLLDTCVGNDKLRPSSRAWHMQDLPWLETLQKAGARPEAIDVVLCTHLHVDHVGWNTRLQNSRWVPTFPNARYLFHRTEYAYWEATREMDPSIGYGRTENSFEDSILPVEEAGLVELVDDGYRIDEFLTVTLMAGHSPGHIVLNVHGEDGTVRGIFTGDILHHPIQCAYPNWNSRYCLDAEAARRSRNGLVDQCVDADRLIFPTHFAAPTAGRITSAGTRARFSPE